MTKPLKEIAARIVPTTEVLYRAWVARLRANKDKQCRRWYSQSDGAVCAIGLAHRVIREHGIEDPRWRGEKMGVHPLILAHAMRKNDEGWTFPQIADLVENMMKQKIVDSKMRMNIGRML